MSIPHGNCTEKATYRKELSEWMTENGMQDFSDQAKQRFYSDLIKIIEKKLERLREIYKNTKEKEPCLLPIVIKTSQELLKRKKRYQIALSQKNSSKSEITYENIERAREYPIKNIVEIGRNGRAKCVFHGGDDYNMGIMKENIAHCFVCGESGDAISVFRAVTGRNFVESVKELSGKLD